MRKGTLIKPNGEELDVSPSNGKSFKLEEMYKLIGCDTIQVVTLANGQSMVVDENGIANKLEVNKKATEMHQFGRMTYEEAVKYFKEQYHDFVLFTEGNEEQLIYGNALVCDKSLIK